MAKILKFVYVQTLFLSIFILLTIYDSVYYHKDPPCVNDKDCPPPQSNISNIRCRKGYCVNIIGY